MQNEREKFKENFAKRLIKFSIDILKFCEEIRKERVLWSVADQLSRSATSIGANIIEAKSSSSRRDYLKFFEIALKSANETKYWLIVISEFKSQFKNRMDEIFKEVEEISKIIGSSVLTLKGKNKF